MTTHARPRRWAALLAALALAVTVGAGPSPAQAHRIERSFFGMHDKQIVAGSTPKVPLGSIRLWDTGTSWRQIETSPPILTLPQFDWSKLDAAVRHARNAGLRPLVVLGQTPRFYASDPNAPSAYGAGASSMPDNLSAWERYVSAVASRYGQTVDYQVWNEPNVIQYWSGSQQQMATLTATASQAIHHSAGALATVVAPGFPLRLKAQRIRFKKYWSQQVGGYGMAHYVDVVALHLYPPADAGPEASMRLLRRARALLPKEARQKPEWSTEMNYGLKGGGVAADPISPAKQAAYVARTLLLDAGSPIRRIYWYAWWQGPLANTHLVKDDRSTITRAGRAWKRVYGWIVGTRFRGCSVITSGRSQGVWVCRARVSRTETRRFYWKPRGEAPVSTVRSTRSWTSLGGHVTHHRGRATIKVGPSPVMVTSRR